MGTILVVNAGSSSVKFEVFAIASGGGLEAQIKGRMDGIGTRPSSLPHRAAAPG
jgi:acetate kinase